MLDSRPQTSNVARSRAYQEIFGGRPAPLSASARASSTGSANASPGRAFSDSVPEMAAPAATASGPAAALAASKKPASIAAPSARSSSSIMTTPSRHHSHPKLNGSATIFTTSRRTPLVYPALLSRVAQTLRTRIVLTEKVKDGLTYKNAFSGSECVDVIAFIIKTTDRNLALLLGRALDAQKFLHDVTYCHRLRDNPNEIYQFREIIVQGSNEDHISSIDRADSSASSTKFSPTDDANSCQSPAQNSSNLHNNASAAQNENLPNGVFTLLTECYSPTCARDKLCYSIACPRRLEQQARLNMKPQGLKRAESSASLNEDGTVPGQSERTLWIHTVSKEVAESVSEMERKRQENVNEGIYTERDFVKDLEYLRDFWIKPLRNSQVIPENRRDQFVKTVFGNVLEVLAVSSKLADALTKRQQQQPIVYQIGDIMLEHVPKFEPFIRYGANQLWGKYEFEKEKSNNSAFARFVDETERLKESRKLELNGYLTKPTTRLARYPLLLEVICSHTEPGSPDKRSLPRAIDLVKEFLRKVNIESGKSENRFNINQIEKQLVFKPLELFDLRLHEEGREIMYRGSLRKRNVAGSGSDSGGDIQIILFDHVLLMVRYKIINKRENLKLHRRLLIIAQSEDNMLRSTVSKRPSSSLLPSSKTNALGIPSKAETSNKGYSITFTHLGRRGFMITLYASTWMSRKKWIEHIEAQQKVIRDVTNVFTNVTICEKYFTGINMVNCAVAFDGGRKIAYGTKIGIYVSDRRPGSTTKSTPIRVLSIPDVAQIDVLDEYGILLFLADRTLMSLPLETLDTWDANNNNKRPRKIVGNTTFFKAGICLARVFVCVVKASVLSSTIKVLEPVDSLNRNKKQPTLRKLLAGGGETFKIYKEFYIPTEATSIHFLKSKLCVGCTRGFEVVDLDNLVTQSLLDPADSSLDFVQRRENVKPIAMYRFNGLFLLCYDEFAFFVNKNGWRTRPEWFVTWEGIPQACAVSYPYLFAFEPSFIEIRHLETSNLVQIIPGSNVHMLADGRGKLGEGGEIFFACETQSPRGMMSGSGSAISPGEGLCEVSTLLKLDKDISKEEVGQGAK